jgi:hypothetical protein
LRYHAPSCVVRTHFKPACFAVINPKLNQKPDAIVTKEFNTAFDKLMYGLLILRLVPTQARDACGS